MATPTPVDIKLPIEGDLQSARKLRNMIGYGNLALVTNSNLTKKTADELVQRRAYCIENYCNNINADYVRYSHFLQVLQLLSKRYLITSAEPGYIVNKSNLSRTYVGFFVPVDCIDTVKHFADENGEVHVYITDALTEQTMREEELKIGKNHFDINKRQVKPVTCDPEQRYDYCIMLRFPLEELTGLSDEEFDKFTQNYVFVQITAVLCGEKTQTVAAVIQGLLSRLPK